MSKGRLEAFSDGVIGIIITIMVLEMKVPRGETLAALAPVLPVFLSYVLSFTYVGIYWNNHHHMLHACTTVTGGMLWANLHLLFLVVIVSVHRGLDGREPFRCDADCALRRGAADGGDRVRHAPAGQLPFPLIWLIPDRRIQKVLPTKDE